MTYALIGILSYASYCYIIFADIDVLCKKINGFIIFFINKVYICSILFISTTQIVFYLFVTLGHMKVNFIYTYTETYIFIMLLYVSGD